MIRRLNRRFGIRYWFLKDRHKKCVWVEPDEDDLATADRECVLHFWAYWDAWARAAKESHPKWKVNDCPADGPPQWRHLRPDVFVVDGERPAFYLHGPATSELPGRAYSVHPLGRADAYHVRVGSPEECSCECLGYESRRICRHILALLVIEGER